MAPRSSVSTLVARLRSGDTTAQHAAALELYGIARSRALRPAIVAAGGVAAFVRCLHSESSAVQAVAAYALCPLADDPAAAAAVLAAGAAPYLVQALRGSESTEAGEAGLGAARFAHMVDGLALLARAEGAVAALLEAGVLSVLLDVLRCGHPRPVGAAARLLADLAECADSHEPFVPAVPSLVRCLRQGQPADQERAALHLAAFRGAPQLKQLCWQPEECLRWFDSWRLAAMMLQRQQSLARRSQN